MIFVVAFVPMAPVGFASSVPEAIVGRLVATDATGGGLDHPVQMRQDGQEHAIAVDARGLSRRGQPADVKIGVHWMLIRTPDGGFKLRRVTGWFEFGKPSAPLSMNRPPPSGDAELKVEANKRREEADRLEKMLERRDNRLGVRVRFGDIIKEKTLIEDTKRKIEHPEDERVNDEFGVSKQKKKMAKQLRKEANAVDQAEEDEVPETANALLKLKHERGEAGWDFSDEEAFSDDEQEKNDFEGGAIASAEQVDEAIPSGDEDEGEDAEKRDLLSAHGKQLEVILQNFEDNEQAQGADELSGDEDAPDDAKVPDDATASSPLISQTSASGDASEKVAVEAVGSKRRRLVQDALTSASAEVPFDAPVLASVERGSEKAVPQVSAEPTAALSHALSRGPMAGIGGASSSTGASSIAVKPAAAVVAASEEVATSTSSGVMPGTVAMSSTTGPSAAAPAATSERATPMPATTAPDIEYTKLRQETIQCLRQQGGGCTLKQLTVAMNLKNTKSERYKNVTLILREVATLKMDPSIKKPVLKLLPEHNL